MALTNNEKQIRHKKLEKLKNAGNKIIIELTMYHGSSNDFFNRKSNSEIRDEINSIINLPSGWTDDDYNFAAKRLENIANTILDNPHLMNNDISYAHINDNSIAAINECKKLKFKAPEVVKNIKSILKLTELNTSDQIAVIAEVMRRLAKELLNERVPPKTYANATALSLIGPQYDKPEWTWKKLAENLVTQNGKDKAKLIIKEIKGVDE